VLAGQAFRHGHPRVGRLLMLVAGVAGIGLILGRIPLPSAPGGVRPAATFGWYPPLFVLGGVLLLGATHTAMVLGHWYLLMRGLSFGPLVRSCWLAVGAVVARSGLLLVAWAALGHAGTDYEAFLRERAGRDNSFLFGARIALHPEPADAWMPASRLVAAALGGLGPAGQEAVYRIGWWGHVLVLLGFLVYLPHSKHLHIITAAPNAYLRSLEPKGLLATIDIERALEHDEPVGVSKIEQFSWKDLLDTYSCTECGRCQAECPASISGKELSPKYLILDLKEHLLHDEAERLLGKATANGNGPARKQMVGDVIHDQVLWDCVTCRACMDACPVFIEHVPKIIDMRRHLVMEASRIVPEWQKLFDNVEAAGNPWRFPRASRADWAKGLGIPTLAERPDAEYLFWVGCAGSYDERNVKVSVALARLLERAGVAFAILGTEETCCGDPVRRAGNEYLFQLQAQQNVETLNRYQPRKIVTACPHCFNTIGTEYRAFGGVYEVVHHVELLDRFVREGRLQPHERLDGALVYHDPCYLGRYHDIYEPPRRALRAIPGVELREMERHGKRAMCCGAGGGHAFCEERTGRRINHIRVEQALEAQPQRVATACPYCLMMFEDGTRAKDVAESLPVADIAELLERSTRPGAQS